MPDAFGTPEHWLQRATEARSMAEGIEDSEAKRATGGVKTTTETSPHPDRSFHSRITEASLRRL